jgi:hypothetical protein
LRGEGSLEREGEWGWLKGLKRELIDKGRQEGEGKEGVLVKED